MTTSQGKQEALACKNVSGTCGAASEIEVTAMQRWRRLWQTTGSGSGIGGNVGNGIGGTVAMVG
jgi:hypothetical protein